MEARSKPAPVVVALLSVVALGTMAACGSGPPSAAPTASEAARPVASATPAPSPPTSPATSAGPAVVPTPIAPRPLDAPGRVVVLTREASLALVDATGERTVLATAAEGIFHFPAWSPDGTKIAAIRYGMTARSILVFDVGAVETGGPVPVTEVFRSATVEPFYLSWLPDSQRISYLASEGDRLSLRLVPADGSAPLDGTGPGSLVGTGNPFYFDWIADDRLLAHVGTGPGALLRELMLDGEAAGPSLGSPGDFRSAVVSADDAWIGSIQVDADGASQVVVQARDGDTRYAVPVFGSAAVTFSPRGHVLATIGAVEPVDPSITVPVGPLRVLDAKAGTERTLLDGTVASFWWSPDGQTIAALRVHQLVPATPGRTREVRLEFVDVESGEVTGQTAVVPARFFIDQLLSYFDQYALSHDLWSPDSSAFLLPVRDEAGGTHVAVVYRDGRPTVALDGQAAFWSPTAD